MMSDNQQQDEQCNSMECSPGSLARRIESCIVRNAFEEEQRAQKALFLLKSRDRRIALLEKRVAELQKVADNMHELSIRNSSGMLHPERDNAAVSDFTHRCERSLKTIDEMDRCERSLKTDEETDRCDRDSGNAEDFGAMSNDDCDTLCESTMSIPRLKLSKSSESNSEKDIFSTAIDFLTKRSNFTTSAGLTSSKEPTLREEMLNRKEEAKLVGSSVRDKIDQAEKIVSKNKGSESVMFGKSRDETLRKQRCNYPRISSSVPWIRAKHGIRKKLRNLELRSGKRAEEQLPVGDWCATHAAFGRIEVGPTDRRQAGEHRIVDNAKKIERSTVVYEQAAGGAHLVAGDGIGSTEKIISMQASAEYGRRNEKGMYQSSSCMCLERQKSTEFSDIEEDPAPQWLIEEALNRGSEVYEKYMKIISELEARLASVKQDLEEAVRSKSLAKEKYKRLLENAKLEARKESEKLQDRMVRICTSVLENFGPNAKIDNKRNNYHLKYRSSLRCHEKISSKLHKKLRLTVMKSSKLKHELAAARKALKNKSDMYESISRCFDELKRDMDTTEMNLNNLIAENLSLRKKIEDTKDWLEERNVVKEHHSATHFRDVHKNRELANLKKKVEEDKVTIVQLRNRLMRSESVNANKGFLLNSYKSQLTDLTKEKDQLVSKINNLENEIAAARNNNSQLKAKISVLNNEKDKLHLDSVKSRTDITEKTLQQETQMIKAKYEETIKSMKMKMTAISNQNAEYSKAIREFLKKVYSRGNYTTQRDSNENVIEASEREAHETACNILNMTPEELCGFINGKTPNSINSWIVELNRILAENNFSETLSKFLFRKVLKKLKLKDIL